MFDTWSLKHEIINIMVSSNINFKDVLESWAKVETSLALTKRLK